MAEPNPMPTTLNSFQEQMRRMDDLEARLNARAVKTRRRMTSLLDQQYTASGGSPWPVRNSHARMWCTHRYQPAKTGEYSAVAESAAATIIVCEPVPETFILQIEGTLLIGHLDHASAAAYDRKTGFVAPTDDLDRSRGEKEDEVPVPAYRLTHLFDKLVVEFQTVFQPRINPMARIPPPSKKKKSRRSSGSMTPDKSPALAHPDDVDFTKCILSERHQVTWTRDLSDDAHAWAIQYQPPAPVTGAFQVHSVICRIRLEPRRYNNISNNNSSTSSDQPHQLLQYTIRHPAAVEHLFPHHGLLPPTNDELQQQQVQQQQQQQQQQFTDSKKRKVVVTTADGQAFPPIDNEIHLPATLSLPEIIQAFFIYLTDHQLMDPEDKSCIVCNAVLKEILGVDRLPFHQLQATLLEKQIIVPATEPAQATYIMRRDTAQPDSNLTTTATAAATDSTNPAWTPALWQWDMEVLVPSLTSFRVRELLRRVKRRELEYTSSRTKARYLLAARRAKDEEAIKSQIEWAVTSHSYDPALQPIWQALAKGAPPHTVARACSMADRQISYLLEQLPGHCRAAREARELLAVCRAVSTLSEGEEE